MSSNFPVAEAVEYMREPAFLQTTPRALEAHDYVFGPVL